MLSDLWQICVVVILCRGKHLLRHVENGGSFAILLTERVLRFATALGKRMQFCCPESPILSRSARGFCTFALWYHARFEAVLVLHFLQLAEARVLWLSAAERRPGCRESARRLADRSDSSTPRRKWVTHRSGIICTSVRNLGFGRFEVDFVMIFWQ